MWVGRESEMIGVQIIKSGKYMDKNLELDEGYHGEGG